MRIFLPPLSVEAAEGFSSKDLFGRDQLGKGLINLLDRVQDPMVLAINGQWGSGKTIFLKMWAGELRKLNFPVIYFDAFEYDYTGDAFTALAAEVYSLIENGKIKDKPAAKKFLKGAVAAGKVLLRSGVKIGVKAATVGALEYGDLSGLAKDLGSEASALTDKYLGELITKQNEQRKTVEAFKEALSEMPALLSPANSGASSRPLIFIIDELDRCRPTFALELLERIKHFFSVANVHFVLGTNLVELENSVVAAYGSRIDAPRYLEKFIHITFSFADTARFRGERIAAKYISYLVKAMDFAPEDHDTVEYTTDLIKYVSHSRRLSLRSMERVMTVLAISLAFTDKKFFRPPPILGGLCVLKVLEPSLFAKAKEGTLVYEEVERALSLSAIADEEDASRMQFYKGWWRFATDADAEPELVQELGRALSRFQIEDRKRVVPLVANSIVDRLIPRS